MVRASTQLRRVLGRNEATRVGNEAKNGYFRVKNRRRGTNFRKRANARRILQRDPRREVIDLRAERQILNNLISEDPTSFADQLAASRDKEFGRQFGKFLKEYRIEEQLRRVAKEGFTGLTFDMENKGYPAEVMQLFKDKRFKPSIKAKFGETFNVTHDDSPIRFFGGSIVGHRDIYSINWKS